MYLTQEECDALPAGARVRVTWSGGNGPHVYTVAQKHWTWVHNCVEECVEPELRFVGKERFHTRVEVVAVPAGHPDVPVEYHPMEVA